jgi:hypothetical protein
MLQCITNGAIVDVFAEVVHENSARRMRVVQSINYKSRKSLIQKKMTR